MSAVEARSKGQRRQSLAFLVAADARRERALTIALAVLCALSWSCSKQASPVEQKVQRGGELLQAHPEKALEEYKAADELGGGQPAKLGVAMAHEQLGQLAEAEGVLLEALKRAPSDLELKLALVRVRIGLGRLDEAREDLQTTLRHEPPHVPSLLLFAALAKTPAQGEAGARAFEALSAQRFATFRESAEQAVADASLLSAKGDPTAAAARLDGAANSSSVSPQLAVAVSDSLKLVGRLREAEWLLERAASEASAPDIVNERLAAVAMDLRHLALAEQAIGRLRTGFKPDPRALLLMARLHELRDDKEGTARTTKRALDALPSDTQASERRRIRLVHIDALIRSGENVNAKRELEEMLATEPKFSPAKVILAALVLGEGDNAKALSLISPLMGEPALSAQIYPLVVGAHRQAGRLDDAERVAREFLTKDNRGARSAALLAEVLAARGRSGEASAVLDAALKKQPSSASLATAKLELLERTQGAAAAIAAAEELAERGAEPTGRLRLAAMYAKHSRDADATSVLLAVTQQFPRDTRGWAELAAAQARLGKASDAAFSLERLVELVPYDTGALTALGSLYKKLGRSQDAESAYERVLEVEPTSLVPLNNLAVLLTEKEGAAKRAVELARRARALAPKDSSIADTLGWALVHTGDGKDLEEGVRLLHTSSKRLRLAEGYYHYGIALMRAGKNPEAVLELERALQKSQQFPGAEDARKIAQRLRQTTE